MYDLSAVLPTDHEVTLRPGTSVLVTGPPMVGKGRLVMDVLLDGYRRGEGALVITTEERAGTVRERFEERVEGFDGSRLGIVECRTGEGGEMGEDTPLEKYLASPADLTGMGIAVTECMNVLDSVGTGRNRLALTSLSTVLSYTDAETAFKFCHVLTARTDAEGYLSLFTLDASSHDDRTVNMLQRAFDVGVEIRQTDDDRRELRVVGTDDGPTDWMEV